MPRLFSKICEVGNRRHWMGMVYIKGYSWGPWWQNEMWAENDVDGKGATFYIGLPFSR
jgi:hypothetical protein